MLGRQCNPARPILSGLYHDDSEVVPGGKVYLHVERGYCEEKD